MREVVRVENLSFSYAGGVKVLDSVSFSIYEGEFLGIIGPNGAGKTTLIKLMLGLLEGFEGKIYLFGKELKKFKEWSRVGYVPQRVAIDRFHPVSVGELLTSVVGHERRLKDLVDFLHMEEMLSRRFTELAGGQQQLVLLGMALSSEPQLLILDEPTAGLDIHSQEHIMELLRELSQNTGKSVVMVSHNLGALFSNADRILAIDRTLRYEGSVQEAESILAHLFGLHRE